MKPLKSQMPETANMRHGKGCVITKTDIPINKVRITGEFIGISISDRNYTMPHDYSFRHGWPLKDTAYLEKNSSALNSS